MPNSRTDLSELQSNTFSCGAIALHNDHPDKSTQHAVSTAPFLANLQNQSKSNGWVSSKTKQAGGRILPVCGDLSDVKIHNIVNGAPNEPKILNTENGSCIPDETVDISSLLRRNAQKYGPASSSSSSTPATSNGNAVAPPNATSSRSVASMMNSNSAALLGAGAVGAATGAAAGALAGRAAANGSSTTPTTTPTPSPSPYPSPSTAQAIAASQCYSPCAKQTQCIIPWILLILLAVIILGAIIAAIAGAVNGHKKEKYQEYLYLNENSAVSPSVTKWSASPVANNNGSFLGDIADALQRADSRVAGSLSGIANSLY
jgi:hypothetical protein